MCKTELVVASYTDIISTGEDQLYVWFCFQLAHLLEGIGKHFCAETRVMRQF